MLKNMIIQRLGSLCMSSLIGISLAMLWIPPASEGFFFTGLLCVLLVMMLFYLLFRVSFLSVQDKAWYQKSSAAVILSRLGSLSKTRGRLAVDDLCAEVGPIYQPFFEMMILEPSKDLAASVIVMHNTVLLHYERQCAWVFSLKNDMISLCLIVLGFYIWEHGYPVYADASWMAWIGAIGIILFFSEALIQALLNRLDRQKEASYAIVSALCGLEQGSLESYLSLWKHSPL